ncbi:MAG: Hsp20/alpha crystallin family protein [Flavobacterium sp.]|nr:MAG: Hsp20/alpha crystallin family protein [Flavobacterium sp.]
MSTLVKAPKNGSLARTNSRNLTGTFPTWSSWIDDLFNNDLPSIFRPNFNTGLSLPMVNISELDDAYQVEMAVPGMKKSDFHIEIDNQVLSISSEVENSEETNDENYTRREFGYASFKRSFSLPETVEEDKIKANYVDGILKLELPKKEEAKRQPPRKINIS